MKYLTRIVFISFFSFFGYHLYAQDMSDEKINELLIEVSDTFRINNSVREFLINEVPMYCITDASNNRMRIISPISEMKDVTVDEVNEAMEANFHSALDVRYCISDNIIWVAFIHPLRELRASQVTDAVSQIYSAALTFGTIYTSTHLAFPKSEESDQPLQKKY